MGGSGRRWQALDIGNDVADLRVAEAIGPVEGHKAALLELIGIGVDAGEDRAETVALADIFGGVEDLPLGWQEWQAE